MRQLAGVTLLLVGATSISAGIALMAGIGFDDIDRSIRFLVGLLLAIVGVAVAAAAIAVAKIARR